MREMVSIEIDGDIYKLLQKHAKPFKDSPNDVLRRLLFGNNEDNTMLSTHKDKLDDVHSGARIKEGYKVTSGKIEAPSSSDSEGFVRRILDQDFGGDLRKIGRYRYMFEGNNDLVYFQNFNKSSTNLWYRISEKAWDILTNTTKKAFLYLTNPKEGIAFGIPVEDIKSELLEAGWDRDYLEVNIDPIRKRWRALGWDIKSYERRYA